MEIEKKSVQLDANTDSLTGLANRRYFNEALALEFQRSKRSMMPFSLILLDSVAKNSGLPFICPETQS